MLAGNDEKDATTLPDFFAVATEPVSKLKIGLISDFMGEGVEPEVMKVIHDYKAKLEAAGHTVSEVALPMTKYSLAMYYIIVPAEISSNLSRYDGVRYGLRAEADTLQDLYGKSRDQGFMPENKRRIMIGNYVLSSGYYDAYYNKAQRARTLLIAEFEKLFSDYDVLLGPVAPSPAFILGENTDDPVKMYLQDVMTVPASLAGLPAISVPAGQTEAGLPVGAQLIGPAKTDARLLSLAKSIEENR